MSTRTVSVALRKKETEKKREKVVFQMVSDGLKSLNGEKVRQHYQQNSFQSTVGRFESTVQVSVGRILK